MGRDLESPDFGSPTAFVLKVSYDQGGEEVAMFNSIEKFQWWLALYREKDLNPTHVNLQIRGKSGRYRLHRFPNMKELKHWMKQQYGPD